MSSSSDAATRTVVDSAAFIALLHPDHTHNEPAGQLLRNAQDAGTVLLTPIIYTELAAHPSFETRDALDEFLTDLDLTLERPAETTLYAAGRAFRTYTDRRGDTLQCPACGHESTFDCPNCGRTITARQHLPSDFLIGAYAAHEADQLLTFDAGFFRDYFEMDVLTIVE